MTSLRTPKWLTGLVAVLCVAAVGVLVILPGASAQERGPRRQPIDPEKLKGIMEVEAKCVAAAQKITGDNASKVIKAYVSARQDYAKKVADLPRTRESFEQRQELGEKAASGLKEALTKIEGVGAEKAEKVMGLLAPFSMSSFRLDRMVGGLIDFKLPKEKLDKAVLAVLEYNRDLAQAFTKAREEGSFEGAREKMQALNEGLNKALSKILSEEQMKTWNETYSRPGFGGRRRQPQQ